MNTGPEGVIADIVLMAAAQNPKAAQNVLYSCHEIPSACAGAVDMGKGFFYSMTLMPARLAGLAEPVHVEGDEFSDALQEAVDELMIMLESHYGVKLERPTELSVPAAASRNTCFHARHM